MNEEKSSMIHELRHSWMAATIAYQERYGQYVDDNYLPCAEANTVVFRLTASDAPEIASVLKERRHSSEGENH